jgi:hypothetical protein
MSTADKAEQGRDAGIDLKAYPQTAHAHHAVKSASSPPSADGRPNDVVADQTSHTALPIRVRQTQVVRQLLRRISGLPTL